MGGCHRSTGRHLADTPGYRYARRWALWSSCWTGPRPQIARCTRTGAAADSTPGGGGRFVQRGVHPARPRRRDAARAGAAHCRRGSGRRYADCAQHLPRGVGPDSLRCAGGRPVPMGEAARGRVYLRALTRRALGTIQSSARSRSASTQSFRSRATGRRRHRLDRSSAKATNRPAPRGHREPAHCRVDPGPHPCEVAGQ